jgi:hypothetical protein
MKSIALALLVVALSPFSLRGQEGETLVGDKVTHGGFGGPVLRFSRFNGQTGFMMGGHGGWIINRRFVIGGAAYGLLGDGIGVPYTPPAGGNAYLTFGYGGIELQYFERPLKLVHFTFSALIGGGGADYRQGGGSQLTSTSAVFVVEPGAGVALNVSKKIRLSATGSYRFVSGASLSGLGDEDLSGPALSLSLDFGRW